MNLKIRLLSVARWIVGLFFVLSAMMELPQGGVVSSFLSLLLAIMLIPPVAKHVYTKINTPIPTLAKTLFATVIFFVMVGTSSASKNKTTSPSPSPTTQSSNTPINTPQLEIISAQTESEKKEAKILKVIDGDTVSVLIDGKVTTIRVIGINTPETVDPRKSVECFGEKASVVAKDYLDGKTVWLEADPSQGELDKYNRLLRYIWTDDASVDYGKVMISTGFAYEYTYNTPYMYQKTYKQAQKDAEDGKKGLWADDTCPTPTIKPTNIPAVFTTPKPVTQTSGSTGNTATNTSNSGDKDCADFNTHAEAQAYFNSNGGSPSNNVDRLDNDHDGIACESLK